MVIMAAEKPYLTKDTYSSQTKYAGTFSVFTKRPPKIMNLRAAARLRIAKSRSSSCCCVRGFVRSVSFVLVLLLAWACSLNLVRPLLLSVCSARTA